MRKFGTAPLHRTPRKLFLDFTLYTVLVGGEDAVGFILEKTNKIFSQPMVR